MLTAVICTAAVSLCVVAITTRPVRIPLGWALIILASALAIGG